MKTLIVSGGIGSGKSALCAMLAERGIPVYDCDSRAKELYTCVPGLMNLVEEALGESFHTEEIPLDRKALSRRIFSDPMARQKLEDILYPALLEDFEAWRTAQDAPLVALESAVILSKSVFDGVGDFIIWVDAPLDRRLERVCRRDALSSVEVKSRMDAQKSEAGKADVVIRNDGTLMDLSEKLDEVLEKI